MKISVLGSGMIGRLIAADLAKTHEVTVYDRSAENLSMLKDKTKISVVERDLTDYASYAGFLEAADLVVTAVPGFMGYKTLETVINCAKNIADISFFPEDALQLHALAKEKNVTVITDCGVAPGLSNLILGYENARMKINDFDCIVGGLPKLRKKPFEYKAPFSPIDVIEEYTRPARYVENGKVVTKPALSDTEYIDLPHAGTLEAFNTDGLRSIIKTMDHIPNMKEKTLRYPGHVDLMKSLLAAGFLSTEEISVKGKVIRPIDINSAILFKQWRLEPDEPEFTIMRVRMKSDNKTIQYFLYDERDEAGNSSMSRTTGYACTAMVKLIAEGHFGKTGVYPPELVGGEENCFKAAMEYLNERGVKFETVTT